MSKTDWLRRDVNVLSLHYCLILSQKAFKAELRRLKINDDPDMLNSWHAHATTHFLENRERGERISIVCLDMDRAKSSSLEQVYALLVHEAVHIWRDHLANIGEKNPSEEFECYGIQAISQELMQSYRRQTSRSKRK